MPDSTPPDDQSEAAAAAFARVLAAEQRAEEAVSDCMARAASRLADVRAHQCTLNDSTDRRIEIWRTRLNDAAARQLAELDRQCAVRLEAPELLDAARQAQIARAVARLADELVSKA